MGKEEIAIRKLEMLMRAMGKAREQSETMNELKAAAFEVLLLNPGSTFDTWAERLVHQAGTELIDVYGTDAETIGKGIEQLWRTAYIDENSGLERTFEEWAEAFATEASVQMYYALTDKHAK